MQIDVPNGREKVPMIVWGGIVAILIILPLRILGFGYAPSDDALRHAAKAVSGKSWPEVLLLRPEITVDHNPGWHWVLTALHRLLSWDAWTLLAFSITLLFILATIAPLPWFKRPEAWLASLAASVLVFPYFADRTMLGRPLLLTMAVTLALLCLWTQPDGRVISKGKLFATVGLMAAAGWVHGSWYLLVLLPLAFVLAREWRKAAVLTFCWIAGSILGALLTGQPWTFLRQTALIPVYALGLKVPRDELVREFQPFNATYAALIAIAVGIGLRKAAKLPLSSLSRDPVLWMALTGWLLGFRVVRFWLDWGLPALALWWARQLEEFLKQQMSAHARGRLVVTGCAGVALFLAIGVDRDGRWSQWGLLDCLDSRRPEHDTWVPEPGGILYSVDLSAFYQTFFRNPTADWRYALGFEPSFMRAEDRAVYEELCGTRNAVRACAPWVRRMTRADRLVLSGGPETRPGIRELEWFYAATNTWVGRLPRSP